METDCTIILQLENERQHFCTVQCLSPSLNMNLKCTFFTRYLKKIFIRSIYFICTGCKGFQKDYFKILSAFMLILSCQREIEGIKINQGLQALSSIYYCIISLKEG